MGNANEDNKVYQIFLDDIIPNRFQPRLNFDEKALQELSDSIKEHGVIQPLVLRRVGDKYEIIAGERRYKASKIAGLEKVPAIITTMDDNKSAEVALVENVQRKDLTPIEEAKSYKQILDKGYLTQEQLAKKIGISQPSIANKLRLLNLTPEVQDALLQNKISERHARSLLLLTNIMEQNKLLNRIITERLTVKQLDDIISSDYKGAEPEEEIPVVELVPNIEKIKNNSEDIVLPPVSSMINPVIEEFNPMIRINSSDNSVKEEPSNQNRFFNFLESEQANMSLEPTNNIISDKTNLNNQEPINVPSNSDIEIIESEPNPFLTSNVIDNHEEPVLDPIALIDSIEDATKEDANEKTESSNIVDAIAVFREAKNIIENNGFNVSLEEADLTDEYQIIIKIKKDI